MERCTSTEFKPLLDYLYTNQCDDEELLQNTYQKFLSCNYSRKAKLVTRLVDTESRDFISTSGSIADDIPVTSSTVNTSGTACDIMSDDDLFCSHLTSRSPVLTQSIRKKSLDSDDMIDLTLPDSDDTEYSNKKTDQLEEDLPELSGPATSKRDSLKSTQLRDEEVQVIQFGSTSSKTNQSELELSTTNQSHIDLFELDQSDDDEILRCSFKSHRRSLLSQPTPLAEPSSVDDVTLSQPATSSVEICNFSVNDSVLLQTALQLGTATNSFKTPTGKARRDLVPITPMPNFSDMETPEIIARVSRLHCNVIIFCC